MTDIHPSAIIEDGAELGANVRIGPYCVVSGGARIGDGTVLHSHVSVSGHTQIGADCEIFPFASIGSAPQDLKYRGEKNELIVGDRNIIREHVTMNAGTKPDRRLTVVGSDNMFMIGAHVAHDCVVGDHVVFANNATIGGFCTVGDYVIIGGLAAVHQFVRVGRNAIIGGVSGVVNDVIPYGMVVGDRAKLGGLNIIGMKRMGMSRAEIHNLRKAYRMIFENSDSLARGLDEAEKAFPGDAKVAMLIEFMRAPSDRHYCLPRRAVAT